MPKAKKKTTKKKPRVTKTVPKTVKVTRQEIKVRPKGIHCLCHADPLNIILNLIGIIVIIYGAWFHELLWVLLGFIPIIVGNWWEHIKAK